MGAVQPSPTCWFPTLRTAALRLRFANQVDIAAVGVEPMEMTDRRCRSRIHLLSIYARSTWAAPRTCAPWRRGAGSSSRRSRCKGSTEGLRCLRCLRCRSTCPSTPPGRGAQLCIAKRRLAKVIHSGPWHRRGHTATVPTGSQVAYARRGKDSVPRMILSGCRTWSVS